MSLLQCVLFCAVLSCVKLETDFGLLDTAKNPFQYFQEQNYTYENHTLVTEDNYELLLVRLPYNKGESSSNTAKPPILFVHGIVASMADFLAAGPGVSFAYRALEEGYDVFLLNTRGTRWSRNHTTLDPDTDEEYWDFSFHEVGQYDLTAAIDYILNLTGYSQISYVGHSQGTTDFLAMASTRPEYNSKIKISVLLAPVAYLGNAKFLLILLLKNEVDLVEDFVEALDLYEFLPYNPFVSGTGKLVCSTNSPLKALCEYFLYESAGPSTQMNDSLLSAYLANYPAGASRKQLLHYLQNANSGEFRQYDYGDEENLVQYGQSTPPDYNLTAITAPIALYYGVNDYFAAVVDVLTLASGLPNIVKKVQIPYVATNHFDLIIGSQALTQVTQPALTVLNEYNGL